MLQGTRSLIRDDTIFIGSFEDILPSDKERATMLSLERDSEILIHRGGFIQLYGQEKSRINAYRLIADVELEANKVIILGPHYQTPELTEMVVKLLNRIIQISEVNVGYRFTGIKLESGLYGIKAEKIRWDGAYHA